MDRDCPKSFPKALRLDSSFFFFFFNIVLRLEDGHISNVTNDGDDDTLMLKMKKKIHGYAEPYSHLIYGSALKEV